MKITVFKHFTNIVGYRTMDAIVKAIQTGIYRPQITAIRAANNEADKEKKDKLKKQLLGFTVSGYFEGGRTLDSLMAYLPYIILDIDYLSIEDLNMLVGKVQMVSYTHVSFISPSGNGYKIIVQVDTSEENHVTAYNQVADYYEKELDIKIDRSGKDITRLCFMSWDEDIYYNKESELFRVTIEIDEDDSIFKNEKTKVGATDWNNKMEECLRFTSQKIIYQRGNRNNFIYLFASNCNRNGVPKKELLSFARKQFDMNVTEIEQTVNSAYKQRQVVEPKLPANPKVSPQKDRYIQSEMIDEMMSNTPCLSDSIFDQLPHLLKESCELFTSRRDRDVYLTSALSILSACVPNVSGVYDKEIHYPNLYNFIIAPAASGKGAMKYARILGDAYHEHLRNESDEALSTYKVELADYHRALAKYNNSKQKNYPQEPDKPAFKILFIPANSSSAMVVKHLKDTDGSCIMCETEADTLGNTLKQDWGGYSDMLRKAYHFERISSSRKNDNEFLEIKQPRLSLAVSGTPGQIAKLITSPEDGLLSRFH